jgi:hypothetical protein
VKSSEAGGGIDGLWKAWENDEPVFPPFPQTLEIAYQRFPHSHRYDDYGMNISQTFNVPGVGQNKMPKWAKPACQTQLALRKGRAFQSLPHSPYVCH